MRKVWSATFIGSAGRINVEKFIEEDGSEKILVDRINRSFIDLEYALQVARMVAARGAEGVIS